MASERRVHLTPSQLADVALTIGELAAQGEQDRAWRWIRRLREIRVVPVIEAPRCSACRAATGGARWCDDHAPAFLRPPDYLRGRYASTRARGAILGRLGRSDSELAAVAGCSVATVRKERMRMRQEGLWPAA